MSFPIKALKAWFFQHRRDLPWRQTPSPYAIWVSEVMLQQTQVAVVIPYFQRWMRRFPTIESLAHAPVDEVIKCWEGLGYYARARNLHAGARYVVKNYDGNLPGDRDALKTIKGLGDYTVGAILNFAFHIKAAAVDGNVTRVITRYYAITDDIAKAKTLKGLYNKVSEILPDTEPWITNEALIELGATVCKKQPQCRQCPLHRSCKGFEEGLTTTLPYKQKKTATTQLYREVAVIQAKGLLLVKKGDKNKVMADLYEFPYFDTDAKGMTNNQLSSAITEHFGLTAQPQKRLPTVTHTFTRYRALLKPLLCNSDTTKNIATHEWASLPQLQQRPFSSGHRQILKQLLTPDPIR